MDDQPWSMSIEQARVRAFAAASSEHEPDRRPGVSRIASQAERRLLASAPSEGTAAAAYLQLAATTWAEMGKSRASLSSIPTCQAFVSAADRRGPARVRFSAAPAPSRPRGSRGVEISRVESRGPAGRAGRDEKSRGGPAFLTEDVDPRGGRRLATPGAG